MPEDFEAPRKPPEPSKSMPVVGGLGKLLRRFRQEKVTAEVAKEPEVITETNTSIETPPAVQEEIRPNIPSRQERRERLKKEYSEREMAQEEAVPAISTTQAGGESPPDTPKRLFEKVERPVGLKFEPTLANMPWVEALLKEPNAKLAVNLVKITLGGTGEKFYFGSFIRGKELTKVAQNLDPEHSQSADALFNAGIADIVKQGYSPHANLLDNSKSDHPIFYFGNFGKFGVRVYGMRFQKDNIPVIIRVAVCYKADQQRVYSQLTTDTHKQIKYRGKL